MIAFWHRSACYLGLVITGQLPAQWQSLNGGVNHHVNDFEYGEDSSKLMIGGAFPYAGDPALRVNNLATWDGQAWSSAGLGNGNGDTSAVGSPFNNFVSLALFRDTLFCGVFASNFQYHPEWGSAAGLHSDEWFSLGNPENWFYLMKVNDRLFSGGRADTLYGQFMPGIREWVGGAWQPIPNMPLDETGTVYCATYWHDQYWFAGSYLYPNGRSVVAFDGVDQWTSNMGPGGGWINAIAGFGDSLYVGGWYPPGSDSESPMIQIWDGDEWRPFFPDVLEFDWQISDVEVHQGALYVSGDFHFIDDPSTPYSLLRFDGHELCAIGGVNPVGVNGQIAFFQGNLYLALASEFPGFESEYIARLPLQGLVPDHCVTIQTGIQEATKQQPLFVYPEPAEDELMFSLPNDLLGERISIQIFNSMGEEVLRGALEQRKASIAVDPLPRGHYFGWLLSDQSRHPFRFVKE